MPLPDATAAHDKHDRGSVLVVGGAPQTPGAVLLSGIAALRAGAGKVQLVTDPSIAPHLGVAMPEALVAGYDALDDLCEHADAVLVGPGTSNPDQAADALRRVTKLLSRRARLVIDAGALAVLADDPELLADIRDRTVLMPNPNEIAELLDMSPKAIERDPSAALADAVSRFSTTVTLRAVDSWTAAPGCPTYADRLGNSGLATAGSGDVFAGVLAGLSARRGQPLEDAVWANRVHRRAGERCADRIAAVGYLARDVLDEVPAAMAEFG
jgi:ADP-dependent NAD(P)H-hydrate dehydratase